MLNDAKRENDKTQKSNSKTTIKKSYSQLTHIKVFMYSFIFIFQSCDVIQCGPKSVEKENDRMKKKMKLRLSHSRLNLNISQSWSAKKAKRPKTM